MAVSLPPCERPSGCGCSGAGFHGGAKRIGIEHHPVPVIVIRVEHDSERVVLTELVRVPPGSDSFSSNFRLRWEWAPGSELFVVYTEDRNTDVLDRWSELSNRGFVIKVNRLLRL